jgi:hypothetical protein
MTEKRWTTERGLPDYVGMAAVAAQAGAHPAHVYAWREVGYLVTPENEKSMPAAEVSAYDAAVERYRTVDLSLHWLGDHGDDEEAITDAFHGVAASLQMVVERVVRDRDPDAVWGLLRRLIAEAPSGDVMATGYTMMAGVAGIWVISARGDVDPLAAVEWVDRYLGADAAGWAVQVAGLLGHPVVQPAPFDEVRTTLGSGFVPALLLLAAGVAATAGGGHAAWLRRYDLPWDLVEKSA